MSSSNFRLCACGCGERVLPPYVRWKEGHRYPRKIRPKIIRFLEKISYPTNSECWLWSAGKDDKGYGVFAYSKYDIGFAHRFSYEYYKNNEERLDSRVLVLHTCDTPACVNPEHLFTGSHQDNSDDMVRKQRQTFGEKNPNAVLTDAIVRDIRERYRNGERLTQLARLYQCSNATIHRVVHNQGWNHI